MGAWQKQIMGELQSITENAGLKFNAQYRWANQGEVYIAERFRTRLSFHFSFQDKYCTLQFYPEGAEPVGTCGFTHPKCIKNYSYLEYIKGQEINQMISWFERQINKIIHETAV